MQQLTTFPSHVLLQEPLFLSVQHPPPDSIPRLQPVPMAKSSSHSNPTSPAARWALVSSRTPTTRPFVYGVTTTKIYCLTTCPGRLARRANVTFFENPSQAETAGYRACKRCRPNLSPLFRQRSLTSSTTSTDAIRKPVTGTEDDEVVEVQTEHEPAAQKLEHALKIIHELAEKGAKISLADLASEVGLSKWHLQRIFKAKLGLSPAEFGNEILEKDRPCFENPNRVNPTDLDFGIQKDFPISAFAVQDLTETSVSPSDLQTTIPSPTMFAMENGFSIDVAIPYQPYQYEFNDYGFNDWEKTVTEIPGQSDTDVDDILRDLFPEICNEDLRQPHNVMRRSVW